MVPLNKQVGFFSDAYTVEWALRWAAVIVRKQWPVRAGEKSAATAYPDDALSPGKSCLKRLKHWWEWRRQTGETV